MSLDFRFIELTTHHTGSPVFINTREIAAFEKTRERLDIYLSSLRRYILEC